MFGWLKSRKPPRLYDFRVGIGWGNDVGIQRRTGQDTCKLEGFCSGIEKGDLLILKSRTLVRITNITYPGDPPDLFFADAVSRQEDLSLAEALLAQR